MAGPPSRPSFPSASGEPSMRRLGVGSSTTVDRPLRAQIVVALIVVLMLIAVPLYLLRRPNSRRGAAPAASATLDAGALALATAIKDGLDSGPPERLKLAPAQRVRCGASSSRGNEGGLCESLPAFEEALAKAIRDSVECAPKTNEPGTINYVLTVDFSKKSLHVFPGASGEWRGRKARRATNCVKRALKIEDWSMSHQHRYYTIAILASYAPPTAAAPSVKNPTATPTFE